MALGTERLYQFPNKAAPVPADIIYLGDSANAFSECESTIQSIIAAYPNVYGIAGLTLGANTYPYVNAGSAWTAGTITGLGISLLADTTTGAMQSTLGLVIGTNVEAWSALLDSLAAITPSNGGIVYSTASAFALLNGTATAHEVLTSGSSTAPTWSTVSALIDATLGSTQGDILYRNSTVWTVLAPGTVGQYLATGGAAANISWGTPAGAALVITEQVISATATYTPTTGTLFAYFKLAGGGGSGGGAALTSSTVAAGGGGGGGGYTEGLYSAAQIGATAAVVIGTGGAAPSAGNNNGNAGNNSTVTFSGTGSIVLAANGGAGGTGSAAATGVAVAGGAGGTASGGNLNIPGQAGSPSFGIVGTASAVISGRGGDSRLGAGGVAVATAGASDNIAGNAGTGYGGGGSGGLSFSEGTATAGGAGSNGVLYVIEFA